MSGRLTEINSAGVAISKRTAGQSAKVFGSIGPAGTYQAFRDQAAAFAGAGVDAPVVGTMTSVDEACMAATAGVDGVGSIAAADRKNFHRSASGSAIRAICRCG